MRISEPVAGERIDRFLAGYLPHYSRSTIQKCIIQGGVLVNGAVVSKHYVLQTTDVIECDEDLLQQRKPLTLQANSQIEFEELAVTQDYIVISKPAGLVVHPGGGHNENDTLASGLLARYPELAQVGEDPLRPGIVHRLDKDVSGVMVVARTQEAFEGLKRQFMERLIYKRYFALAHGVFVDQVGTINFDIVRSTRERTKMAAVPPGQGKTALTEYEVVQQFQHYAYLSVRIHTGRTHQIRAHLNAIGHPVVGDQIYKPKNMVSRLQPGRLFLHATELQFHDAAGQLQHYTCALPTDLQAILDHLYSTI